MLRNFDAPITDIITGEPNPYMVADGAGGMSALVKDGMPVMLTVRVVLLQLLMGNLKGDENSSVDERLDRARLAEKLQPGGNIDITVDDVALIKKISDKAATAAVVLPIRRALETEINLSNPA